MSYLFSFEKLDVWVHCREITRLIYLSTQNFPDSEKFGLINQTRRAAVSVCSNIAEGSSRSSLKEQAYFYQMAYGSLMELLNQLIISNDLGFMNEQKLKDLREKIERAANMLNSLRKSRL